MNGADYERLTHGRAPLPAVAHDAAYAAARDYRAMASACYSSASGADVADAPRFDLVADVYALLADGAEPEATLAWARDSWRRYAEAQQARVAAAPRVRRGPCAGHSVIAHRWVPSDVDTHLLQAIGTVARWLP